MEARNGLEALVHSTDKTLKENGDKVPAAEKAEVESAIAAARGTLEGGDVDAIKAAAETLSQAAMKMGEALYKAQAAEAQASTGGEAGGGGAQPGGGGAGAQGGGAAAPSPTRWWTPTSRKWTRTRRSRVSGAIGADASAICAVNRTTSVLSGGLIHAAVGNRRQRSAH